MKRPDVNITVPRRQSPKVRAWMAAGRVLGAAAATIQDSKVTKRWPGSSWVRGQKRGHLEHS